NDIGMWQGALRDRSDPAYAEVAAVIDAREPISIELLYSDQVGEQRTITRFGLLPIGDDSWFVSTSRHWFLDRAGPRSDAETRAAAERIMQTVEAARAEAEAEDRDAAESAEANGGEPRPADGQPPAERQPAGAERARD